MAKFKKNANLFFLFLKKMFKKFFKEFLRISFIFDIKLIYYFSEYFIGYLFYLFCIFYGFFGCSHLDGNCNITHGLAAFFVLFMIGIVLQTYLLLKIPPMRLFIENLVTKNFLEKHLGNYTGSEGVSKFFKYALPAAILGITDMFSAQAEENRFNRAAKLVESNYQNDNKLNNYTPSREEYMEKMKDRDAFINKGAHAKGVMSRSFGNVFGGFACSAVNK